MMVTWLTEVEPDLDFNSKDIQRTFKGHSKDSRSKSKSRIGINSNKIQKVATILIKHVPLLTETLKCFIFENLSQVYK